MKLCHTKKWTGEYDPLQKGLCYAAQCSREMIRAAYLVPVLFIAGRVQDINRDIAQARAQLQQIHPRLEYFVENQTTEFQGIYPREQDVALALANKKWRETKTDLTIGLSEAIASMELNPLSLFKEREIEDEKKDYYPEGIEEVTLASLTTPYECADESNQNFE